MFGGFPSRLGLLTLSPLLIGDSGISVAADMDFIVLRPQADAAGPGMPRLLYTRWSGVECKESEDDSALDGPDTFLVRFFENCWLSLSGVCVGEFSAEEAPDVLRSSSMEADFEQNNRDARLEDFCDRLFKLSFLRANWGFWNAQKEVVGK